MTTLGEDELIRASTNSAEQFVDAYYEALSNNRQTLASYYMPMTALPSGRTLPLITYNGQQLSNPNEFQNLYQQQMPLTHFEVQSLDAHVLNPSIAPVEASTSGKGRVKELENNMSLLVQVSGYVRLYSRPQDKREAPMRGFSDTIALVPNKEGVGAKGKGKTGEGRSWIIQNQNFRFVV